MPAPRAVPANLNAVLTETLALYNGLLSGITIDRELAPALPPVRLDVEQIRRVVINLIDNAIEARVGDDRRTHRSCRRSTIAGNAVAADRDRRQRTRRAARRSREAVHAVLLDQAARQRPRPGHRPAHRRRARRIRSKWATILPSHGTREFRAVELRRCWSDGRNAILIVDDEAGVRSALSGVLRDEGYTVDAVDSGEACLDRAVAHAVRRDRARHLAARHGRPRDARAGCRSGGSTRRS